MRKTIRKYRICHNPKCNDWNDEPEYIPVPYDICASDGKNYICMRAGWHQKNTLPINQFFNTKEECLDAISNL